MDEALLVYKALADKNRLRILWALHRAGELCACRLVELLGISGAAVSQHLALLCQAGLCSSRKDGRWMRYAPLPHPLLPDFSRLGQREDGPRLAAILAISEQELCRLQKDKTPCC